MLNNSGRSDERGNEKPGQDVGAHSPNTAAELHSNFSIDRVRGPSIFYMSVFRLFFFRENSWLCFFELKAAPLNSSLHSLRANLWFGDQRPNASLISSRIAGSSMVLGTLYSS